MELNQITVRYCDHVIVKWDSSLSGDMIRTTHDFACRFKDFASCPSLDLGALCIMRRESAVVMPGVRAHTREVLLKTNQILRMSARVCLDKRGSSFSKVKGARIFKSNPCLSPGIAIKEFCRKSGLEVHQGAAYAEPLTILKSSSHDKDKCNMHMLNIFVVSGLFAVADISLFAHVLVNGLGSRKTYGFGLIRLEDSDVRSSGFGDSVTADLDCGEEGW